MKWIIFAQTINDRVRFITDESYPDRTSLSYRKFCDIIFKYPMKDPAKLQEELDFFHTVFLNTASGEWHREYDEKPDKITFETLSKLNPSYEEQKKINDDKENREVNLTKAYFNKSWENKRNGLFSKYRG
jgi:hypothetical protein